MKKFLCISLLSLSVGMLAKDHKETPLQKACVKVCGCINQYVFTGDFGMDYPTFERCVSQCRSNTPIRIEDVLTSAKEKLMAKKGIEEDFDSDESDIREYKEAQEAVKVLEDLLEEEAAKINKD